MSQPEAVVSVDGVTKGFGDGAVLDGVDLRVPSEEITLLIGPNGVGKTILLSCIAGGLSADTGEITVFGEQPEAVDASVSFMLQDAMLVDQLTGRENVDFFNDLHPQSTDEVTAILDRLEFETDALEREVGDYSGGMKRKLEFAISLSADVPLYLLDEPTAALDMTTVETVHSLLAERRDAGATVLLSSHLPTDVELTDHIAVITETGVSATGSPPELAAGVPRVVLAEGTADISAYVRDGRLFEDEIYRRGFLATDTDPEAIPSAADETTVQLREPSHTDIFNYYVHFNNEQDE